MEQTLDTTPAKFFGVVIVRDTKKVKGVFNPDYDWQLACHKFDAQTEDFRIFSKAEFGVSTEQNSMTPFLVKQIVDQIEADGNL